MQIGIGRLDKTNLTYGEEEIIAIISSSNSSKIPSNSSMTFIMKYISSEIEACSTSFKKTFPSSAKDGSISGLAVLSASTALQSLGNTLGIRPSGLSYGHLHRCTLSK